VNEVEPRAFVDAILRVFHEEGWKDLDDAAASLTVAVAASENRSVADLALSAAVPADFLERNGIDADRVERALRRALGETSIAQVPSEFELVPIDEIDSFATVAAVDPKQVSEFSSPLLINERVIKHCIHSLIGDPYIDSDWGGERSDVESGRVQLDDERVAAAFLLKGRSVPGPLYGSELGTRGDQIIRLLSQRAELSVVQHIHSIPNETVDQLRYGVIALRATGTVPNARCSVWDGVDTARLLLAANYIDESGELTPSGSTANEELKQRGR